MIEPKEVVVRKCRQGLLIAASLCFVGVVSYWASAQNLPTPLKESHGTINIVFANQNGLVAVTDSMLSSPDNLVHDPNHQKLFRVDDKTIAMMAGSYSRPGIGGKNPNFDLWVPNIMNGFSVQQQALARSGKALSFARKFSLFREAFEHQLTSNLQAAVFNDPTLDVFRAGAIELTLAGYDIDGALKVGEVTLTPEMTPGGVAFKASELPRSGAPTPTCELRGKFDSSIVYDYDGLPKPRVVGDGLFCEVAGLLEGVAEIEMILNEAIAQSGWPAMRAYVAAEKAGQPLSTDELVVLASELEARLAEEESATGKLRIGGDRYLAVLRNGHVETAPEINEVHPTEGNSLNSAQFKTFTMDCRGTPPRNPGNQGKAMILSGVPDGMQMGITLEACEGDLADGVLYHDSHFNNSILDYSGSGPIRFGQTNTVSGSTLKIGNMVDLKREDVKSLICTFPWTAVYHGQEEIHMNCK